MIHGQVGRSQAIVDLIIRLAGRPDLRIACVIDTGFEGAVTLPPAAVAALGLPFVADLKANLADDSDIRVDVHVATILWNGQEQEVAVLAMGRRPLIGTALLDGHHLGIDFAEGGVVQIEALQPR